jgi:hypothetical protein
MGGIDTSRTIGTHPLADLLNGHPQLRAFMRADRIAVMPARPTRRRLLLECVAQAFEPGVRYPEAEVNEVLRAVYDDPAALRRYLIDEDLLSRRAGIYWRSGGPVALSSAR